MKIKEQLNWQAIIVQVLVILGFMALWARTNIEQPFVFGAITYFVISYLLRTLIPRTHRLGITFIRHSEFAAAIDCFEASYQYFSDHSWIDRWRSLTMLTVSNVSYREMALLNIAHCYAMLGEEDHARQTYEKVIKTFPGNEMAAAMLQNWDETPAEVR